MFLEFTFHYASTLSDRDRSHSCLDWPFTFHYASTLSWWRGCTVRLLLIYIPLCFYFIGQALRIRKRFIFIYIPLCFYFIRTDSRCLKFPLKYLHSTMLLLYHTPQKLPSISFFNLHSTMLLLYQRPSSKNLGSTESFTFHYASTLSTA